MEGRRGGCDELFAEAWRLRTVDHIPERSATRPSVTGPPGYASEAFRDLPRALKVLAWQGAADEDGKARAQTSWRARWMAEFPSDSVEPQPQPQPEPQPEPQPNSEPNPESHADQRVQSRHEVAPDMQALEQDKRRLEQEKRDAQQESARFRQQLDESERRLREAARLRDAADASQQASQQERQRMGQEIARLQRELDTARTELDTARTQRQDVEQRIRTAEQQRPPLPSDSDSSMGQSMQLSAATITVLTKFGCADAGHGSNSDFRSQLGLLGVQLYLNADPFGRYDRLFFERRGDPARTSTVEDLLVDREKKFLTEASFRKRYQEALQRDPETDQRVWKTKDHDQLRAVFSAFCLAKQVGLVNLSQQLPPTVLRLSLTDLRTVLLESCSKVRCAEWGSDLEILILKSPEHLIADFVRRYQQGYSISTEKSGVQRAQLSGQDEQRAFTGFDLFPDVLLQPPNVEGMESKFPEQRIKPLGSQTKLILTAWELEDGVDASPFQASTRWQLKPDATITVRWSTLEPDGSRNEHQHVMDYVRFDGAGFQRQDEVFDQTGAVISREEMQRKLLLKFGDGGARNERAVQQLERFSEDVYQTCKHYLLAITNQYKQAVFLATARNEHPPARNELLPAGAEIAEPAEVHKAFRCIVQFEDFPQRPIKNKSWLDEEALNKAMVGLKQTFKGSDVLDKCKTAFSELTSPPDDSIKMTRGLLLWGPPGTGKTTIMENLAEAAGFHMIVKPFAGADINSGKVGDTEKILGALTDRSHQLTWAPCCLVIDEIDALAPDRDAKASEHKVDALSKLLSVFGGIDDHRNLFVFGATNRKTDMDKAFLRRLEAKFYVGVPDPDARMAFILGKLPALIGRVDAAGQPLARTTSASLTHELLHSLVNLTTNFSGANIEKLCAKVSQDIDGNRQRITRTVVDKARKRAREVCEVEDILLGDRYLPDLLNHVRGEGEIIDDLTAFFLRNLHHSNGKIFADLSGPTTAVRDHIAFSDLPPGAVEMQLSPGAGHPKQRHAAFDWAQHGPEEAFTSLVTALTKFAIDPRVRASLIKVVTGSSMTRAKKYDENSMLHELEAIVAECRENPCAIICFDLESLVRVQTDEGGPSERPRVLNSKLMFGILDIVRQHAVNVGEDDSTSTPRQMFWICIASTHPYLTQQVPSCTQHFSWALITCFWNPSPCTALTVDQGSASPEQVHNLLRWPKTEMEQHLDSRDRERTTCIKCGLPFSLQGDNDHNPCKYHRDRFDPLKPLRLIPTFDRQEQRPPEPSSGPDGRRRDRAPRPTSVSETYYDPLEIPSVVAYIQEKTRERGHRQYTYAHWRRHVRSPLQSFS